MKVKEKTLSDEQSRNSKVLQSLLGNSKDSSTSVQGMTISEISVGNGRKVSNGDRVKVQYIGRLKLTNKVFDSSLNKPFVFRLGRGEVIRGCKYGLIDYKLINCS